MTQSIQDWLNEPPPSEMIRPVPDSNALHLEIESCEKLLDEGTDYRWSSQNFHVGMYNDDNGDLCAWGTIELGLPHYDAAGDEKIRSLTGTANLRIKDLLKKDIPHWAGTLKSECIKNSLTDWGTKTGRGLNAFLKVANSPSLASVRQKMKPDNSIRSSYEAAKANDNKKIIKVLEETYDFNATETKD